MSYLQPLIIRLRPHAKRASWAVLEQAASPIVFMVLTPFLLRQLGSEQFGLWMLVMAVMGMGQLTSLGAGTATIKHVSADLGAGKPDEAVATIRAAVTTVIFGGVTICSIVVVFAPLIAEMFFAKMGEPLLVSKMIMLAAALIVVQELDNVFASALRGAQRFDLSAKVEFVSRIIWAVCVAVLAWHSHLVFIVLCGVLLFSLVKIGVKAHLVNRLFSVSICYKPIFERVYLKRVIDFGKWQWLQNVGGMMFSVADRLLIGAIFGAADLARYSICLQLAQYLHTIPAAAMQVIFPWLSSKMAKGETTDGMFLYRKSLLMGFACLLLPALLFMSSPAILTAWLGERFYTNNIEIELILVVAYSVLAFNVPAHFFLMGLGQAKFVCATNLVAGIVSITAAVLLAPLGLVGFAVAKLFYAPIILFNFSKLKGMQK